MMPDHTLMMLFVLQSGASRMSPSTDVSSSKSVKMDAFTLSQVAKKQKRGSCKCVKPAFATAPVEKCPSAVVLSDGGGGFYFFAFTKKGSYIICA